jgi:hypothetical protein
VERGEVLHTMPLFKLFPGRPSKTFFSSSFFFGGIFLLDAKVRLEVVDVELTRSRKVAENRTTVLLADR